MQGEGLQTKGSKQSPIFMSVGYEAVNGMATIDIDDDLASKAREMAEAHGYESVDKYVEDVLYRDIDAKGFDPSKFVER